MSGYVWPAPDDWAALLPRDAPWSCHMSVLPVLTAVAIIGDRPAFLATSFTMCGLYQAADVFGRFLDAGCWLFSPALSLFGASRAIRRNGLARCMRPVGPYPIDLWLAVSEFVVVPSGVEDRLPADVWAMVVGHIGAGRHVIFLKDDVNER